MSEQIIDSSRVLRGKAAGVLAVLGSLCAIAAGMIQWRQDIPRGDALDVLAYVEGRPWFLAAYLGIIGMICWAVALSTAGRALADPHARALARMVDPIMFVGVAVFSVDYAHDGVTTGVLAGQWADGDRTAAQAQAAYQVVEGLVGGTTMLAHVLIGSALTGYAVALLRSRQFSPTLCWFGIVLSFGWFAGGSALFLRLPGAGFEFLLPFTSAVTIWLAVLGIMLLRNASRGVSQPAAFSALPPVRRGNGRWRRFWLGG
ncbi:DUF4386 domain-containing protein [Nocardia brasiliensis]|uniref:DUF4386 domain-containing protein n=1 Tax=Nocardia brasiliensis TaxID=37326 RepID=UPI0037976090